MTNSPCLVSAVCRILSSGVAALFGPSSSISAAHVQSICDAMEMPHVETRWDCRQDDDFFSINLYPQYMTLSRAYIEYIVYLQWKPFAILYETNEGERRWNSYIRSTGSCLHQKLHVRLQIRS